MGDLNCDLHGLPMEDGLGNRYLVDARFARIYAIAACVTGLDLAESPRGDALYGDRCIVDDGILRVRDVAKNGGSGGLSHQQRRREQSRDRYHCCSRKIGNSTELGYHIVRSPWTP